MSEHPDSDEFVAIDDGRLSGAPSIRGTRIFASTVRELGWDTGKFYDVPDPTISGVLAWWERHGKDWPDGTRLSKTFGCVVWSPPEDTEPVSEPNWRELFIRAVEAFESERPDIWLDEEFDVPCPELAESKARYSRRKDSL